MMQALGLRALFNRIRRRMVRLLLHRVVFGERSAGVALPYTRISPTTCIEGENHLRLGDHVYVGPFNVLDATAGLTLEEGVQITSFCSLTTHSSHRSMRLMGRRYAVSTLQERPGWICGPIAIGAYSFIGPHSVIEAGTHLGRGTLVCAGSVVRGTFPDFAVLRGHPAQIVGDTRQADAVLLAQHPQWRAYRAQWAQDSPTVPADRDSVSPA